MADWQRDHDDAEIKIISECFVRPTIIKKYGGKMTHDGDPRDWSIVTGDQNVQYLRADSVGNFSVQGKLSMSRLVPGRNYKGVFELQFTREASGWQGGTFTVSLTVPGSLQPVSPTSCRSDSFRAGTIFNLCSNTFQLATAPQKTALLYFTLSHTVTGPYTGKGLIIRRFVIQQK